MIGHGCMIGGDAAAGKGVQIIGRVPIIGERRVVDVTDGLIHRWRLTENASDIVGTLHLTNNGSVTFSENGASFNGSTQWLSCSKTWPATFTATMWVKYSTAAANKYIFGACRSDATNGFGVHANTDVWLNVRGGTVHISSGRDLSDSEWHLIGVEGHSTGAVEWKFYIDGALEGTGTPASFTLDANFALGRIGAYGYYFAGNELDARIYSQALTADQHAALYANGPNP